MLILTRKPFEKIFIGTTEEPKLITIVFYSSAPNRLRCGFEAPPHFQILREEVYLRKLSEEEKFEEKINDGN
jgi:carbon storage regulator CsrA